MWYWHCNFIEVPGVWLRLWDAEREAALEGGQGAGCAWGCTNNKPKFCTAVDFLRCARLGRRRICHSWQTAPWSDAPNFLLRRHFCYSLKKKRKKKCSRLGSGLQTEGRVGAGSWGRCLGHLILGRKDATLLCGDPLPFFSLSTADAVRWSSVWLTSAMCCAGGRAASSTRLPLSGTRTPFTGPL